MAIWGTLGIFVRNIALASAEIALFRAIIALFVIGAFQLIRRRKLPLVQIRQNLPLLCLSGAAMGANWILLFEAYRYTTVSIATLSYYFAPAILMIVCPLLFHERIRAKQVIYFLLATAGLVLVIGVNGTGSGSSNLAGIAFGLSAAVLYASVVLINKRIQSVAGIDRTQVQFLVAVLVLLPYVLISGGVQIGSLDGKGLLCLLILGLVHTGLCYCLFFSVIPNLSGQQTAILSYIDPFVAILMSVLILNEGISRLQIIGGTLILCFTLLNEKSEVNKTA
ncbi:MAG: DMT family transporter [Clostridia bacterium]